MDVQARGHSQGGLENHGIRNVSAVYWNLPAPLLYEEVIRRREGRPGKDDRSLPGDREGRLTRPSARRMRLPPL